MTLFATLQSPHQAAQRPLLTLQGAIAGTQSYLLTRLAVEQQTSLFIVTPDARQRDLLARDLYTLFSAPLADPLYSDTSTRYVCTYDPLPTAMPGSVASQQQRAVHAYEPLWRLLEPDPVLVVTAVESLRYGVIPPVQLHQRLLKVCSGTFLALDTLIVALVERGYRRTPLVESIGSSASVAASLTSSLPDNMPHGVWSFSETKSRPFGLSTSNRKPPSPLCHKLSLLQCSRSVSSNTGMRKALQPYGPTSWPTDGARRALQPAWSAGTNSHQRSGHGAWKHFSVIPYRVLWTTYHLRACSVALMPRHSLPPTTASPAGSTPCR